LQSGEDVVFHVVLFTALSDEVDGQGIPVVLTFTGPNCGYDRNNDGKCNERYQ
jgi:hypothetical protein